MRPMTFLGGVARSPACCAPSSILRRMKKPTQVARPRNDMEFRRRSYSTVLLPSRCFLLSLEPNLAFCVLGGGGF